jgi:hypothetical protein
LNDVGGVIIAEFDFTKELKNVDGNIIIGTTLTYQ